MSIISLCLIRRSKYSKTRQDSEEEKHLNPGRHTAHTHTQIHTHTHTLSKQQRDRWVLFFSSFSLHFVYTLCQTHLHNICSSYTTHICHPPLHTFLSSLASSPPSQGWRSTWTRSPTRTPIRPSTSLPRRSMLAVFTLRGLLAWVSLIISLIQTHTHTHADLALTLLFALCVCRRVWGGVQRPAACAGEEGDLRGHQESEGGLHWQTEEGLPVRGLHHGTVWPSQHHQAGGRHHQMWVGVVCW